MKSVSATYRIYRINNKTYNKYTWIRQGQTIGFIPNTSFGPSNISQADLFYKKQNLGIVLFYRVSRRKYGNRAVKICNFYLHHASRSRHQRNMKYYIKYWGHHLSMNTDVRTDILGHPVDRERKLKPSCRHAIPWCLKNREPCDINYTWDTFNFSLF